MPEFEITVDVNSRHLYRIEADDMAEAQRRAYDSGFTEADLMGAWETEREIANVSAVE